MAYDPNYTRTSELRGNFEDIAYVRKTTGDIPKGPDGQYIILPDGRTDLTGAWGILKMIAEHGELSWNARTPGREKFVTTPDDARYMKRRMSRNHPQVIDPDPDTGLKRWRWVIDEPWHSDKSGDKSGDKPGTRTETRQIVYIARQVPDAPRTVELIDEFVSEDDALLPASVPNPDMFTYINWFFREAWRRLFHPGDIRDRLFPHRKK